MSVAIPDVDAGGFDIPDVDTDAPDLSEAEQLIRRFIEGKREDLDRPHRDADILMHYYHDREMSQAGVAEELGCGDSTVSRWLDKTDIEARRVGRPRAERASFKPANSDGHEEWTVRDPDKDRGVTVHQLLAVADGADPADVWADGTHIHHKTCVPWLNLPGFVEVLDSGQHRRTHAAGEWTTEDGLPVLVTQE